MRGVEASSNPLRKTCLHGEKSKVIRQRRGRDSDSAGCVEPLKAAM
ncbi:unnamed protein product, partial [Gulo gulo]